MFPRRRPVAPAAVEHRDSCGGQGQHQEQRGSGNDRDRGGGGAFPPAEAAAKAECSSWTLQQGFATASGEEPAWASRRVRERRRGGAAKGLGEPRSEVRGAAPALREGQAAAEGSEAADGVRACLEGSGARTGGRRGRAVHLGLAGSARGAGSRRAGDDGVGSRATGALPQAARMRGASRALHDWHGAARRKDTRCAAIALVAALDEQRAAAVGSEAAGGVHAGPLPAWG